MATINSAKHVIPIMAKNRSINNTCKVSLSNNITFLSRELYHKGVAR